MKQGLLPRRLPLILVRFGRRRAGAVLIVSALAWLVAGLLASRVRVDTELLSLVPRDNPVVAEFETTIERFGSVDQLLGVVHLDPDVEISPQIAFADHLAAELRGLPSIEWVEYRLDDVAAAAVPLLDSATLFLTPDRIDRLLAGLAPGQVDQEAARLRSRLMAPQGVLTEELLRIDPVGLLPAVIERLRPGSLGITVDPATGCLLDPERRYLLILAKPTGPAQDLAFDRRLAGELDEAVTAAATAWAGEGWDGRPPAVEFTGGYIIALDDSRLITADVVVGLVSSLIGVMILFLLAFQRPATLLYAVLPLVTGIGLTFAFTTLALGRLNSLTSAFGGLVIGLGIDFIIVLYGRYAEERRRGASHADAVDAMGRHTGVGVLLGAVTTAATFYAFLVTEFRGLWELGLITGTGILILVVTVYIQLPALLSVTDRINRGEKRLALHSFGSDLLCRAALARPWLVIAGAVLLTTGLGIATRSLEFDDDMQNMRSEDNRGISLREEVMQAFKLRFSPLTVRIDGADEQQAFDRARQLLPTLDTLVDEGMLASVDSIVGVIPTPDEQRAVIARLAPGVATVDATLERFRRALRGAGLNPAGFATGIDHLARALTVSRPLSIEAVGAGPLGRAVDRYVVRHDDGVSVAIYCYPPADGRWRRKPPPALVAAVATEPGAVLTGPIVVSVELRRIVWRDAAVAAVIGLIAVFVLLWLDLGSPLRSLLALLPLFVGLTWMLGAMALCGLRINFMNIFVLTMIIGIGVDYGVHLLHRWYESGGATGDVAETAKAIGVAALTTVVGFGSLVLSHYPGLRSVGAAAILGALSTAILSITLLPVLLTGLKRRG